MNLIPFEPKWISNSIWFSTKIKDQYLIIHWIKVCLFLTCLHIAQLTHYYLVCFSLTENKYQEQEKESLLCNSLHRLNFRLLPNIMQTLLQRCIAIAASTTSNGLTTKYVFLAFSIFLRLRFKLKRWKEMLIFMGTLHLGSYALHVTPIKRCSSNSVNNPWLLCWESRQACICLSVSIFSR